jgi:hypothetical protein
MKKRLWIIVAISFLITIFIIANTFALFESESEGETELSIAKWNIDINNNNITSGLVESFTIDSFTYTPSNNIEDNYIAPGRSGYFEININPNDTEVAIRYDIEFDVATYQDNLGYTVSTLGGTPAIKTGPQTYSGVITLAQIASNTHVTIRINIDWLDVPAFNDSDTELGTTPDNKIEFPIQIHLEQYLGEEIIEYQG